MDPIGNAAVDTATRIVFYHTCQTHIDEEDTTGTIMMGVYVLCVCVDVCCGALV